MWMQENGFGWRTAIALGCVGALASAAAAVEVRQQTLSPTIHAPKAHGRARLALKSASSGRLKIAAQRLAADATFDIVADGVKVATLRTGHGGSGKTSFGTKPRGRDALLGFDPRGARLAVRDGNGDDVLEGEIADDGDPNAIACCLADHGEIECEDRSAEECAAEGGTAAATASCLPDPCAAPPGQGEVICCLTDSATGAFVDDDPEVECEDRTAIECAAAGGTVVQATSCHPNPCAPVPPPNVVVCCVAEEDEDGEIECELRTPERCASHQGTVSTATSCDPNPCGGSGGDDGEHGDGDHGDGDHGDHGGGPGDGDAGGQHD